jgi:hypothetical protein
LQVLYPWPEERPGVPRDNGWFSGSGWGHISAASLTLVAQHLFLPVVTGTVYVIDTSVKELSPRSLAAVNDLGPGGKTWTPASLSFPKGRPYAHTMREIICIGR